MNQRVEPNLLLELKDYGAVGLEKCISCGNCTAICGMSTEDSRFPRSMIRMGQLGLKDEILGSKELWLCYNCGMCSDTCPQEAEPANTMTALRGYAISHYSPFKIGELFYKKPVWGSIIATLMVLFFGMFMYVEHQPMPTTSLKLFGFIPYPLIHIAGLVAILVIGLLSLITVINMFTRIAKINHLSWINFIKRAQMNWLKALWESVVVQAFAQSRYRESCDTPENRNPWFFSKWFVHAATMWGFLGLLLATVLDYLLDIFGVKATGTFVPIWYPTRLIGTLAGVLFVYGVSVLLIKRLWQVDKAHSFSHPSDWIFLTLLLVTGFTGFIIEIALYLPGAPIWAYYLFIFHVAVAITLLLLLPFTKFAHVIYRTAALYINALKPVAERETVSASAD
jgi:nitrate reductase gamma subunit/ferredoxin